jgi:glycosyltransferase involved in cell wall biosynthesis
MEIVLSNRNIINSLEENMEMAMNKHSLSIGIPVFNGEKYLGQALDSILDQTYQDFEIIISDNASTDQTEKICRKYSKKDDRIHYFRSEKNHGAAWNWNRVFELSSGVYFKWVAHDDIYDPQFLAKCINVLEKDPTIILCHSKNALIDELGNVIGRYEPPTFSDSQNPHERFREVLNRKGFPTLAWLIFGVFRRDALKKTRLFGGHIAADWNFLAEASLIGRLVEIPDFLFLRRKHDQSYAERYYDSRTGQVHDYRTESLWWTGKKKRPLIVMPYIRSCLEFLKSINHVGINFFERMLCYREILDWLLRKGWMYLKYDFSNEIDVWRIKINYGEMKDRMFLSNRR